MTRKIPPEAFEYYVGLGQDRSYRTVAEHYSVTTRAIAKCAARENWVERLEKIEAEGRSSADAKLASKVEKRQEERLDASGEMEDRHLKTVKAMHARALTALKQYPLNSGMEAMRAAEMCIKLERLIMGEASERTEMSVEEITKREMGRWLVSGSKEKKAGGTAPDPE